MRLSRKRKDYSCLQGVDPQGSGHVMPVVLAERFCLQKPVLFSQVDDTGNEKCLLKLGILSA